MKGDIRLRNKWWTVSYTSCVVNAHNVYPVSGEEKKRGSTNDLMGANTTQDTNDSKCGAYKRVLRLLGST
jgi:hypothetical protein